MHYPNLLAFSGLNIPPPPSLNSKERFNDAAAWVQILLSRPFATKETRGKLDSRAGLGGCKPTLRPGNPSLLIFHVQHLISPNDVVDVTHTPVVS